ncbi:MAG TPA: folate-binding protein [Acidisphaera sp.]|nr:folate-binding protein [Acidisphaera sp.]
MTWIAPLPTRGVLALAGDDRVSFLQGLVSNDVAQAAPGHAVWAAFLTPQGKYLTDFFVLSDGERLLLDCEADQIEPLAAQMKRYRLRAKVSIEPLPWHVAGASGPVEPPPGGVAAPDPRLPDAGWRILSPEPVEADATEADWDLHRLRLGLPDGARDLEREKSILLEAGFDELNGVSFTKGCYLGQELTARTKYRGLVKRRLIPVHADRHLPPPGTQVMAHGAAVGTMRSSRDGIGLATIRLDAIHEPLECGGVRLTPTVLPWMKLPEPAEP